ncbi:MAG: hypothetical protein R6X12_00505 [bacterium]
MTAVEPDGRPAGPGGETSSGEDDAVTWTVHKFRESPAKSAVVGGVLVAFAAFVLFAFGLLLTVVTLAVLAVALNTWYLPVTYTLDRRGATVDKRLFSHTWPWSQFRRWFRTANGVVLSPFSRPTFLDTFRGAHLLLPAEPQAVLDRLARQFSTPAEPSLDTPGSTDKMDGIQGT